MRCFVAVDLDPQLRQKVIDIQKGLSGLDTKLVEPENLHFTLKFLGEIDEGLVNKVKNRLENVLTQKPFTISLEGVGVFPSDKFIRVVWIGAPELTNLQEDINKILAGLFKKEKPSPHLTLARVRSQKHGAEILDFVKKHGNEKIGTMSAKEIKLKKSTVTNKSPVYEDIVVFELKA